MKKNSLIWLTLIVLLASCHADEKMFTPLPASESGIVFNNEVPESEQLNILQYEYMYNGGGVGVADFNGDGMPDIYFSGNRVSNKLYLNRGNMKFEDVTAASKTGGNGRWSKGVAVIDINNDRLPDLYVCAAVLKPGDKRSNLLFVNQGADKTTGVPVFKELAGEYGLADTSSTQMAAFFDFDNDGDLDVYLLVNELDENYPNQFRPIRSDGSSKNTDRLLKNDFDESVGHAVFTDVSREAGITWEGHGLGLHITDINNDGWEDIYVGNDYISNNLLYINDHGKFTNRCSEYFKHSSRNAMGNDIADLNNDGLQDIIELDMMPEDNRRMKLMNNPIDYQTFQYSDQFGYMHQYARNTLQLNRGPRVSANDSIGEPVFSEIAFLSGVAQTDWSWSALAADVDNDSHRDLMISNGLPKDLTDLDFMAYRRNARPNLPVGELLKELPVAPVSNYIFHNEGDLHFTDKTVDWGWDFQSTAAGMAYADFDLDGDLDLVLNNTNMQATLFRNGLLQNSGTAQHYLRVRLEGDDRNTAGLGSIIRIYYQGMQQVSEQTPYRGYLSSVENVAHFGLGASTMVDSVVVRWPDGRVQVNRNVAADQVLAIRIDESSPVTGRVAAIIAMENWFTDITRSAGLAFTNEETDEIDFNTQRLLPHKLSQYGPALAAGDLDGDGLDDLVIGGNLSSGAAVFMQRNGGFQQRALDTAKTGRNSYDMGLCLFDVDGDNDLDLYIAAGGNQYAPGSGTFQDRLYLNDGKGGLHISYPGLPVNQSSKSCVKASDFDGDGDLDLFIGGRMQPGKYPSPASGFLYRNDTKNGIVRFTDVTKALAPSLNDMGMITDAIWTDFDNDGTPDLVITGEWMSITILKNQSGRFAPVSTGLEKYPGWWNSIAAADIDNDGDMDYVVGNFGENGFLRPTNEHPIRIFGKDFDQNGSFDALMSTWLPIRPHGEKAEFPAIPRDQMIEQIARMRTKYPLYEKYAAADMDDVLIPADREGALELSASEFSTGWIENVNGSQFRLHHLPTEAQFSPVFGMVADDFDGDGHADLLINGNDFGMAPGLGRNDALNGLVLRGDGKGNFRSLSILESGIFIPGNGKAAIELELDGTRTIAVSQNRGSLKLFKTRNQSRGIRLLPDDVSAIIESAGGVKRKVEFCYGSSFLSQSSRVVQVTPQTSRITVSNRKGIKRIIQ